MNVEEQQKIAMKVLTKLQETVDIDATVAGGACRNWKERRTSLAISVENQNNRKLLSAQDLALIEIEMYSKIAEHLEGTTLTQNVLVSSSERFTQELRTTLDNYCDIYGLWKTDLKPKVRFVKSGEHSINVEIDWFSGDVYFK